jgi:hypothetical protein
MNTEYDLNTDNALQPVATNGIGIRHSSEIGKLAAALAKAQGEYEKAVKDSENPFYKSNYADLATVISASRKALSAHDLAIVQSPRWEEGLVTITTVLAHGSGEWMADDLKMPVSDKLTAQTVGIAITYGRRYALQAFLGIAGEDDDGNLASGKDISRDAKERDRHHDDLAPRMDGQARITTVQAKAFLDACKQSGKTFEQVVVYLRELNGYIQAEEMQKQHFNDAIKWALAKGNVPADMTNTLKASVEQAQFRKLFAVAKKNNVPETDIHIFIKDKFGLDSLKEVTPEQFKSLCEWVESVPA